MQFTLSTAILALAATTTASMAPRSEMGSWSIVVTKSAYANGFQSQTIAGNFSSPSYPDGIVSTCSVVRDPAVSLEEQKTCDDAFSAEYDGQSKLGTNELAWRALKLIFGTAVTVQQNVELPTKQTVFGNAPLTLTADDAAGRTSKGDVIVDVTSAIA